tara:strand:+ start:557 stop:733 length:177 start_codon:yes stop_codon:yes gene_type:complete
MYLYGTFNGSKSKIVISAETKKEAVEKFLKANPELNDTITNEKSVSYQRSLIKAVESK